MKIKGRSFSNPVGTLIIFLMPFIMYIYLKACGLVAHREWIWVIMIPALIVFWFILNFRIVKNNGDHRD